MKEYVCECGRVFTEPNKFNGHKSNCRIHHEAKGTLEQYEQKRVQASLAAKVSGIKSKERAKERKQQELEEWISKQHTCERCGKVMVEKFGSGRFCCKACANSHDRTEESKKKTSESIKANYNYVTFNGVEWTQEAFEKILEDIKLRDKKVKERKQKRQEVFELLDVKNSPYRDFDCVFINSNEETGIYYYFTKHNDKGTIIERALCPQYRYIMEKEIGRKLNKDEVVHHIDFNHFNNERSNLVIMDRGEHTKLHQKSKI